MRSKLAPEESFWRQLAEEFDEKAALEKLNGQIAQQRRAIALAGRILTLRNMPGFSDFQLALTDMRDHAVAQLSNTTAGNDWMRVLQGQVQAYNNLLGVMEKGDGRVRALEHGLAELQNQKALIERPRNQKPEAKT